jgi:hypothetical protein
MQRTTTKIKIPSNFKDFKITEFRLLRLGKCHLFNKWDFLDFFLTCLDSSSSWTMAIVVLQLISLLYCNDNYEKKRGIKHGQLVFFFYFSRNFFVVFPIVPKPNLIRTTLHKHCGAGLRFPLICLP